MASSQEDIEAVFHAKGGLFFVRLKTRELAIVQLVSVTKGPGERVELIEAAPPEAIEQHPEMAPVRPELWHLVLHESAIVARLADFEGNDLARFLLWRGADIRKMRRDAGPRIGDLLDHPLVRRLPLVVIGPPGTEYETVTRADGSEVEFPKSWTIDREALRTCDDPAAMVRDFIDMKLATDDAERVHQVADEHARAVSADAVSGVALGHMRGVTVDTGRPSSGTSEPKAPPLVTIGPDGELVCAPGVELVTREEALARGVVLPERPALRGAPVPVVLSERRDPILSCKTMEDVLKLYPNRREALRELRNGVGRPLLREINCSSPDALSFVPVVVIDLKVLWPCGAELAHRFTMPEKRYEEAFHASFAGEHLVFWVDELLRQLEAWAAEGERTAPATRPDEGAS